MNIFKERPGLLNTVHGLAVVKKYNRVALKLTEYELLLYRAWTEHVFTASQSLQVLLEHCFCWDFLGVLN